MFNHLSSASSRIKIKTKANYKTPTKIKKEKTTIKTHVKNQTTYNHILQLSNLHLHSLASKYTQPKYTPSLHPQTGGGSSSHLSSIIDLTTDHSPTITTFENVTYPSEVTNLGVISIASNLKPKQAWRPSAFLPTRKSSGPIWDILPENLSDFINPSLQQHPTDVILFLTQDKIQNLTTAHLRELITHGSMTIDAILNTFLELLCNQKQMHYLSTFFITLFRRDRSWESIQDWFNTGNHFVPSQPQIDSTLPILIPCHVHGSHWVGIVRRVLNRTVHFFYADDLNLNNIENALQTFLFTHSDRRFYPANAIWTHCNSITYRPHSNECGP